MSGSTSNLSGDPRALSETQYRELFQNIREGFFVAELVRDEHGRRAPPRLPGTERSSGSFANCSILMPWLAASGS